MSTERKSEIREPVTINSARTPRLHSIPVAQIYVKKNVRTSFDQEKLKELAESIRANGIIQPLLVRPVAARFELVAGERRLRAAKMIHLAEVPCVVREMSDALALEAQLIENTHREDMTAVDEAFGVRALYEKLGVTAKAVGERLGRSDFYVVMMCAITNLPPQALAALRRGVITKSGAYEIAKLKTRADQVACMASLMPDGEERWDGRVVSVAKIKSVVRALLVEDPAISARTRTPSGTNLSDILRFWRYYLLQFTPAEFSYFKEICKGRYDSGVMAEAVSVVYGERKGGAGSGGTTD